MSAPGSTGRAVSVPRTTGGPTGDEVRRSLLAPDDELGPPRRNGELVFEAPWEGRAFGLAVALAEAGRFEWDQFRSLLVEETAAADRTEAAGGEPPAYYVRWARALERLLDGRGDIGPGELDAAVSHGAGMVDHHPQHAEG